MMPLTLIALAWFLLGVTTGGYTMFLILMQYWRFK